MSKITLELTDAEAVKLLDIFALICYGSEAVNRVMPRWDNGGWNSEVFKGLHKKVAEALVKECPI